MTGQPLDAAVLAADWTPVVRRFDDESAWTCLDALGMRPDVYTCAPLDAVLGDSNADWGLLLYPIPTPGRAPALTPRTNPAG